MTDSAIPYMRPDLPPLRLLERELRDVWRSGRLSNYGPKVQRFERAAARWIGTNVAISAASGDAALYALVAAVLEGQRDRRVLVSDWTFQSTINAVVRAGGEPVIGAVRENDLGLSMLELTDAAPATILATHAHGSTTMAEGIARWCKSTDRVALFDAAHAFRPGVPIGHGAAFSLSGTKTITCGEGGLVVPPAAQRWRTRQLLNYGFYGAEYLGVTARGVNGKMSELHAALAFLAMRRFNLVARRRRALRSRYRAGLRRGVFFQEFLDEDVPKDLVVLFRSHGDRTAAEDALGEAGIETKRYFRPLSTQPAYEDWWPPRDVRAASLALWYRSLCLPFYPALTFPQVDRVCAVVRSALGRRS